MTLEFGEFYEKALKHLEEADLVMLVLKGHLLLEEVLTHAIAVKMATPQYVDAARLTFAQKAHLVHALYPQSRADAKGIKVDEMRWTATMALNRLRNQFAHKLEPTNIGPILKDLYVKKFDSADPMHDPLVLKDVAITLTILIGSTTAEAQQIVSASASASQ